VHSHYSIQLLIRLTWNGLHTSHRMYSMVFKTLSPAWPYCCITSLHDPSHRSEFHAITFMLQCESSLPFSGCAVNWILLVGWYNAGIVNGISLSFSQSNAHWTVGQMPKKVTCLLTHRFLAPSSNQVQSFKVMQVQLMQGSSFLLNWVVICSCMLVMFGKSLASNSDRITLNSHRPSSM